MLVEEPDSCARKSRLHEFKIPSNSIGGERIPRFELHCMICHDLPCNAFTLHSKTFWLSESFSHFCFRCCHYYHPHPTILVSQIKTCKMRHLPRTETTPESWTTLLKFSFWDFEENILFSVKVVLPLLPSTTHVPHPTILVSQIKTCKMQHVPRRGITTVWSTWVVNNILTFEVKYSQFTFGFWGEFLMVLVKEVLRRFFDVSGKSVADKRSFTVLPPGCAAINSKKNNAKKIALHCKTHL